jgi:hypothetical protein
MDYFFESDILEEQRIIELEANTKRGNHKSATLEPEITEKEVLKDVRHGFAFPFPRDIV